MNRNESQKITNFMVKKAARRRWKLFQNIFKAFRKNRNVGCNIFCYFDQVNGGKIPYCIVPESQLSYPPEWDILLN